MMELWGRIRALQIAISFICIGSSLIPVTTIEAIKLVGAALCGFGTLGSIPAIYVSKKQRNNRNMEKM